MIYLDNAATTWPKPWQISQAMVECIEKYGANPGRSGHKLSLQAGSILLYTRELLCSLFNVQDPFEFIHTQNCTDSLNIAIKGLLRANDHVITSSMEHNSVVRPLMELKKQGLEISFVKCSNEGILDPDDIRKEIKSNTRLIVTSHASNVTGTLLPISDIASIAKDHGISYLVDAAQTAGSIPIDLSSLSVDLMAMPGHKGLLGPQGTGILFIRKGTSLKQLREGGTGSESESLDHPQTRPDKYEAGTLNTPGIAGLGAGIKYILDNGQDCLHSKVKGLEKLLICALSQLRNAKIYGPRDMACRSGIVSINIGQMPSTELADILDQKYDIAVRGGLHCAPMAHRTIGSLQQGTVRLSLGPFNTIDQIKYTVRAIEEISRM